MRLAACSVAGSLPRSLGTAVASPDRAPPAQLKVHALQWHSRVDIAVLIRWSGH